MCFRSSFNGRRDGSQELIEKQHQREFQRMDGSQERTKNSIRVRREYVGGLLVYFKEAAVRPVHSVNV